MFSSGDTEGLAKVDLAIPVESQNDYELAFTPNSKGLEKVCYVGAGACLHGIFCTNLFIGDYVAQSNALVLWYPVVPCVSKTHSMAQRLTHPLVGLTTCVPQRIQKPQAIVIHTNPQSHHGTNSKAM